jgi:hypothetical protein
MPEIGVQPKLVQQTFPLQRRRCKSEHAILTQHLGQALVPREPDEVDPESLIVQLASELSNITRTLYPDWSHFLLKLATAR